MNNVKRRTRLISAAAVLTALGTVLIYLVGVLPTMQLALAAIAGLLPALPVMAGGMKWGLLTYAATGILSVLLVPDKGAALAYIMLFGHWAILKSLIERKIRSRVAEWAVKLVVCNLLFAALLGVVSVLVIDLGEFGLPIWALFLAGSACFVVYDYCFSRLITVFGARFVRTILK